MQAKALAMLALALFPASPALAADSATVTLVTPVVYGTHLPGLGEPAARLGKLIRERSGGSLGLDLKEPGEGTKPQEILDKLSSGSVDAGFATASYWTAKIPAAALFAGFPFGPDGKTYLDWELDDPAGMGVEAVRPIRDEIKRRVEGLLVDLGVPTG